MTKNIKTFFKENKEGMIIGTLTGFLAGKFLLIPLGVDLGVFQTQGIIDPLLGVAQGTVEFAKTKALLTFTIIGLVLGTVVDLQLREGWFKRFRK